MPGPSVGFGPFTYDFGQRVLYRDGVPVPLMPKTADLLHVLLERRGHLVGKAELMKLVWPDTHVEETGLARNISLLRKALGDEGVESRYIETVPKRGYRFLACEPTEGVGKIRRTSRRLAAAGLALASLAAAVWWQFYQPSRFVTRSAGARLAVIPFDCFGGPVCQSVFARPFEDLLAAELSRQGGLRLVSPSTVHRYRDNRVPTALMARLLGLDAVLEGSIVEFGPDARIVARLTDTHSGRLIWSQSFELPAGDAGQTQHAAAQSIGAAVRTALAGPPKP